MSYEDETECTTSIFRCVDPIQNFKIRVILQSAKSRFILLPNFESERPSSTSESLGDNEENITDKEEYVFSWQEKIFSKSEIAKYSNSFNCKTKLHEKYHEEVTKISNSNIGRLYSYVDADDFKPKTDYTNPIYGKKNHMTILSKKMDALEVSGSAVKNFKNISKSKVVNYSPSNDFTKQNHFINLNCQKMFIMADLSHKQSDDVKKSEADSEEFILCSLVYDPANRVLRMSPSFSKETNVRPYTVGLDCQYSRSAYHYWLHHASPEIPEEELINERKIVNKVLEHDTELRKLLVGNDFVGPTGNDVAVAVFGEIAAARNFECDNVLVRYMINLHSGWRSADPDGLAGLTQTARTDPRGSAHFCHLFDADLAFDSDRSGDPSPRQPEIFFEVLSIDKWSMYRSEGYGCLPLPRDPGIHTFHVDCWRAADDTVKSQLERFFIGGSQVLEDISYVGVGAGSESKRVMSRFGFRSLPTGSLDVTLNILHQSEAFAQGKESDPGAGRSPFARGDTDAILGNVTAVLEAFRQAKDKLLKAKESLHVASQ